MVFKRNNCFIEIFDVLIARKQSETPFCKLQGGSWYSARLPGVVALAQDHAAAGVATGADVREHRAAAGAFEAVVVPVPVQRVQEESFRNFAWNILGEKK